MKRTRIGFYFRYHVVSRIFPKVLSYSRAHRCFDFETVLFREAKLLSNNYLARNFSTNDKDSTRSVPCTDTGSTRKQERTDTRSTVDNVDGKDDEEQHLKDLLVKALSFLAMVDETALGPQQLAIHRAHVMALKARQKFYCDPFTGYQVMTRLAHLHRGNCCGNACRHCPFGQKSAPADLKRTYNSAFYE